MKLVDRSRFGILLLLPAVFLIISCSGTMEQNIERGSTFLYEPGYPEVTVSAFGLMDEEQNSYIEVTADITYESMIFSEDDEGSRFAEVEMEIQAINSSNGDSPVITETKRERISEAAMDEAGVDRSLTLVERLDIEPGNYELHISVTDMNSGNRVTRTVETHLPDFDEDEYTLSNVRLYGKDIAAGDQWRPVTSFHVQSDIDSLRFVFQVISQRSTDPLELSSRLIRFDSDTSHAEPMHYPNRSSSSIIYRGIDYRNYDVIQSTSRTLEQYENTTVEFRFANQQTGTYRFETQAVRAGGEVDEVYKAREFSVMSENFPDVRSPRELAAPLAYLMGSDDHQEMMEIQDDDSLKEAIDRFWLSNVRSESQARQVISMYYERVEEANKQFTNFKEGWKTDLGMIYILFGPPWYVDRRLNRMQWSYSYDRNDPQYNFYFERPRMRNQYYPFDNYLLQRSQNYFNRQYQQVELWRTGHILNRNI